MGEIDIENLFRIYNVANSLIKKHGLLFSFKIDEGTYETAIEFIGFTSFHPPISQNWSSHPLIFCPDLLDWDNKIIIEYEEEIGKPLRGAKLAKKGHQREGDLDNKRDTKRNEFYKRGGFRLFRIYDSDKAWAPKLEKFLIGLTIY